MDLPSVVSGGYSFQVEMAYRALLSGARIAEVPIIFTERQAGCSKMSKRVIWEISLGPDQVAPPGPRPSCPLGDGISDPGRNATEGCLTPMVIKPLAFPKIIGAAKTDGRTHLFVQTAVVVLAVAFVAALWALYAHIAWTVPINSDHVSISSRSARRRAGQPSTSWLDLDRRDLLHDRLTFLCIGRQAARLRTVTSARYSRADLCTHRHRGCPFWPDAAWFPSADFWEA